MAMLSTTAVTAVTVGALAACSGGTASQATAPASSTTTSAASAAAKSSSCKPGATPLTFWGWAPGYQQVVNEFNKTHPDICVTLEDNGASDRGVHQAHRGAARRRGHP